MNISVLADLDDEERREVLRLSRRRVFGRGEVVFHRGDPADTVHFVAKGRFAVRITTPMGDVATLAVVGRGATFGELALLSREVRRSATVQALEPAETHALRDVEFDRLRERNPKVVDVLLDGLAARVEALSELLVEALYVPADRRVLRRLVDLGEEYGPAGVDGAVDIPLTQEDLAGLAGAARATVNRILREEQERGTLRLRRGVTTVVDLDALSRRAAIGAPHG